MSIKVSDDESCFWKADRRHQINWKASLSKLPGSIEFLIGRPSVLVLNSSWFHWTEWMEKQGAGKVHNREIQFPHQHPQQMSTTRELRLIKSVCVDFECMTWCWAAVFPHLRSWTWQQTSWGCVPAASSSSRTNKNIVLGTHKSEALLWLLLDELMEMLCFSLSVLTTVATGDWRTFLESLILPSVGSRPKNFTCSRTSQSNVKGTKTHLWN